MAEEGQDTTPGAGKMIAGRFCLVHPIGQGGMASVWAARDTKLDSEVAVKFLDADLTLSHDVASRFEREALAVSRIKDIHVVRVLDYGHTESNQPYMILERMQGYDLQSLLEREGRLPIPRVVEIAKQLLRALASAHEVGVIHRDIKPANIFLTEDGPDLFVRVLDFGVAKMQEGRRGDTRKLTRPDEVIGTLEFMSPEQALGTADTLDARADLFAAGVVAYFCVTGQAPFPGDTLGELLLSLTRNPLVLPSQLRPESPPELDPWFTKALAIQPQDRYQSAAEMAAALRDLANVPRAGVASFQPPAPSSAPRANVASFQPPAPSSAPRIALPVPEVPPESTRSQLSAPTLQEPSRPPERAVLPPVPLSSAPPQPSAVSQRAKELGDTVLDSLGKHRDPVVRFMDRAGDELRAWTPEVLRRPREPLKDVLSRAVERALMAARLAVRDHREAVLLGAALTLATIIVFAVMLLS